ncbi:MAG TPA: 4-(cytidine 5'-diphospho)-2-C-methyl-D-erythritol kinase [Gemmatimonadaceae bacterium]
MSGLAGRIKAQGKINLHLRVFDRDSSGYHAIETVFQRIELSDWLTLKVTEGRQTLDVMSSLGNEALDLGPPEQNLAYRAAEAYAEAAKWPPGFEIQLTKWIPVGAGLGGGSADAAGVLRLLNFLAVRPLSAEKLHGIAATLGSDVPFLVSNEVIASATGRGDRISPLPLLLQRNALIVVPRFSVPTKDAYTWLDQDREAGLVAAAGQPKPIDPSALASWRDVADFARNDFLESVTRRYPALAGMLAALRETEPVFASMTGSGSALFSVYDIDPPIPHDTALRDAQITPTRTATSVVQPIGLG